MGADLVRSLLIAILVPLFGATPTAAGPFEDAAAAYVAGDHAKAAQLFRPLAEEGDARAQNNLGIMYTNGDGVPRDYSEAVKWFRRSAEQGDASAQTSLGSMYFAGRGVNQDYGEAATW
ncbi:MAG: sel1 repeat family protein, partial [Hyphomicrobiales bacterium]|nr:sel1 repeat family protein [Hyphomicrobiales bacterium]